MRMKSTNEFYEFTPVLDEVVGEVEDLKIHVGAKIYYQIITTVIVAAEVIIIIIIIKIIIIIAYRKTKMLVIFVICSGFNTDFTLVNNLNPLLCYVILKDQM